MGIYDVPWGTGDGVGGFKCLGPWEEPELVLGEGRTGIRVIEILIELQTKVPQILLIRFTNAISLLLLLFVCVCVGGASWGSNLGPHPC